MHTPLPQLVDTAQQSTQHNVATHHPTQHSRAQHSTHTKPMMMMMMLQPRETATDCDDTEKPRLERLSGGDSRLTH